jgi:hypothetical protein
MTAAAHAKPPLRGLWFFALAIGGLSAGAAVILWDHGDWTGDQKDFAWSGPFMLWGALICAQTAAWAVAVPMLAGRRKGLAHLWEKRIVVAGAVLWLFALVGAGIGAYGPDHGDWGSFEYVDHRTIKIGILGAAGSAVAMYGVLGLWAVYRELKEKLGQGGIGLDYLGRYIVLQEKLQALLVIVGSLLGLTIFAVAAERNAVLAWGDPDCPTQTPLQKFVFGPAHCETHFPPEYMLIYGFFFTTLLAFAYAPAQLALVSAGRRIRDSAAPLDNLAPDAIVERHARREALESLLDLKLGTFGSFRSGLAILTPLLGSLTAVLFGAGG